MYTDKILHINMHICMYDHLIGISTQTFWQKCLQSNNIGSTSEEGLSFVVGLNILIIRAYKVHCTWSSRIFRISSPSFISLVSDAFSLARSFCLFIIFILSSWKFFWRSELLVFISCKINQSVFDNDYVCALI